MKITRILLIPILVFCLLLSSNVVKADEGMLLPIFLKNYIAKMKEKGLKLSAEDIYNINTYSLKDAVVSFGGYCTGEIISNQGLLLTNHHCGYSSIQQLSSSQDNYLKEGYWAISFSKEIPVPGLSVNILQRMEDVTDSVLQGVSDTLSEQERMSIVHNNISKLIQKEKTEEYYQVEIKDIFSNNQYILMVYEKFEDIRFVGAPPSSIGKFGGDIDNWEWPRHTGDFSLFRIYAEPNGKPAKYSPNNAPYTPKYYLPISIKGVKEGDYAMIMGFPGSTDRELYSKGVSEAMEIKQPTIVNIMKKVIDVMDDATKSNEIIKIKYASKRARIGNSWKYYIGQSKQLRKNGVYDKKLEKENNFVEWTKADTKRQIRYGSVFEGFDNFYDNRQETINDIVHLAYIFGGGSILVNEIQGFVLQSFVGPFIGKFRENTEQHWENISKQEFAEFISENKEKIMALSDKFYKDFDVKLSQKIYATCLETFSENINPKYKSEIFNTIEKKCTGDFSVFTAKYMKKSIFRSAEALKTFLDNPKLSVFKKEFAFVLGLEQYEILLILSRSNPENRNINKNKRLYYEALLLKDETNQMYPDANFTMRVSYGNVLPYKPFDGAFYNYYTTMEGIIQKEDSRYDFFEVPKKMKSLYEKKDYGRYANQNNELVVNFISNNDITGGNSGSPVIDGEGHLIGCAFDGNWEAMSGDIFFEKDLQRTISVDVRYILFIIDKFAESKRLINEMTIIE